jgi:hypothetical protein
MKKFEVVSDFGGTSGPLLPHALSDRSAAAATQKTKKRERIGFIM